MDKQNQPTKETPKSGEKKPQQQGGNFVWYMLGLGVLVLLMVTMFNRGSELSLTMSEFERLIEASNPDRPEDERSIVVEDKSTAQRRKIRLSDPLKIVIYDPRGHGPRHPLARPRNGDGLRRGRSKFGGGQQRGGAEPRQSRRGRRAADCGSARR